MPWCACQASIQNQIQGGAKVTFQKNWGQAGYLQDFKGNKGTRSLSPARGTQGQHGHLENFC